MKVGELKGTETLRQVALKVPEYWEKEVARPKETKEPAKEISDSRQVKGKEELERKDALAPKSEDVDRLVELINEAMEILNYKLKFTVHKETNQVVVKVLDKETDEVIREIPPEQILNLVAKFRDAMGLFIDTIV